jgi:hypothetical protein
LTGVDGACEFDGLLPRTVAVWGWHADADFGTPRPVNLVEEAETTLAAAARRRPGVRSRAA